MVDASAPSPAVGMGASARAAGPAHVVAVGASAGGLEVLQQFFGLLPADTGAAYVVIQHLSPDHRSMMEDLLGRHTAMPVRLAEHDSPLVADTVVLIPPGKTMRLSDGRLQLAEKPQHGLSLPIDLFFDSLAAEVGPGATAVVLSGTGSDGSRGVVAVADQGGCVLVQDPVSARFDGMPRSAQATGVCDLVAPVDTLARHLLERLRHPEQVEPPDAPMLPEPYDAILARLHEQLGINFADYKPRTLLRRIQRRLQVLKLATMQAYLDHLTADASEAERLRRELLIPVTQFFRDPDAFETLARLAIAPLAESTSREPVRVWVAACATGEEAYSIAMLFAEAFERAGRTRPLKIFATDVEPQVLEAASLGLYPASIESDVSPARLQRFFLRRDDGWQVRPELRQSVLFARHDLATDPPFTRIQLASCRNALIYLLPTAQERALQRLQFALLPECHLFLGSSESLGAQQRNFAVVHMRHRLFRLIHREALTPGLTTGRMPSLVRREGAAAPQGRHAVEAGQRALARAYVPPSLLVGRSRELLHVYGDARSLLGLAEGQPSLDVLRLLPAELGWVAALLLRAAFAQGGLHRSQVVHWGSPERPVRLVARALPTEDEQPVDAVVLSLEEAPASSPLAAVAAADAAFDPRAEVEALEGELQATQRTLQATIEELETSNEELQATNEELMASNEELQSTNEELQSVNEELYTVNSEYQEKVSVLNSLNADLENVSQAAAIPTLFVDEHLRLLRFTPEAAPLFRLREQDVGRSLEDFAHAFDYPSLYDDLRATLRDRQPVEREVRTRDGHWWLARLHPYITPPGAERRAVMTLFDIGALKQTERLQAVVDALPEHVAVLDLQGNITLVNRAWRDFAKAQGDNGQGSCGPGANYLAACTSGLQGDTEDAATSLAALEGVRDVLSGRSPHFQLQYPCHGPDRRRWFVMHAAPVGGGGAVVSHVDITPWFEPAAAPAKGCT